MHRGRDLLSALRAGSIEVASRSGVSQPYADQYSWSVAFIVRLERQCSWGEGTKKVALSS